MKLNSTNNINETTVSAEIAAQASALSTNSGGTCFRCPECGRCLDCSCMAVDGTCIECYNRNTYTCKDCGGTFHYSDVSNVGDYCINCYTNNRFHCIECKNTYHYSYLSPYTSICSSCYYELPTCPICGKYVAPYDRFHANHDYCCSCGNALSISIDSPTSDIFVGDTYTLNANVSHNQNLAITWTSLTPSIATIDSNGTITALNEGTARILASALGGRVAIIRNISILPEDTDEYLDEDRTIKLGEDVYIISSAGNSHPLVITNENSIDYGWSQLDPQKTWRIIKSGEKHLLSQENTNTKYVTASLGVTNNISSAAKINFINCGNNIYKIQESSSGLYFTYTDTVELVTENTEASQLWMITPKNETNVRFGFDISSYNPAMNNWGNQANCKLIGRYLATDSRRITASEVANIANINAKIFSYFQMNSVGESFSTAFNPSNTDAHPALAIELATNLGQPANTAIYFAVDYDIFSSSDLEVIRKYFEKIKNHFNSVTNNPKSYKIGVYGNGLVCNMVKQTYGYADYSVLWGIKDSSGYADYFDHNKYDIIQFPQITITHNGTSGYIDLILSHKEDVGEWNSLSI